MFSLVGRVVCFKLVAFPGLSIKKKSFLEEGFLGKNFSMVAPVYQTGALTNQAQHNDLSIVVEVSFAGLSCNDLANFASLFNVTNSFGQVLTKQPLAMWYLCRTKRGKFRLQCWPDLFMPEIV